MDPVRVIKSGDIKTIRNFLNQDTHNVNERIEKIGGLIVDGPLVILAIDQGDLNVLELLVKGFGANINQDIIWGRSASTIFIYAMAKAIETNNFSVVEKLLTYDCNLNRPGCIRLDNYMDSGTPLAIATGLKDTDYSQRAYKLSEILVKHSMGNWKGLSFEELRRDILESKKQIKIQTQILNDKLGIINQRLSKSKSLEDEIKECEASGGFLTEDEIALEARTNREKLAEPRRILRIIQDITRSPDYIEPGQLVLLENQVDSQSSDYRHSHLECTICKQIPMDTMGYMPKAFVCNSDHLLCESCLARIETCPICKQGFVNDRPKRNGKIEEEIFKLQTAKRKDEEAEAISKDLPLEVAQEFQKIAKSKQKAQRAFKKLEEKAYKARVLHGQKKCIEAMSNYKSADEIDTIQVKSDARIAEAKKLHQKIASLKMNPDFLSKDERKKYKELADSQNTSYFF